MLRQFFNFRALNGKAEGSPRVPGVGKTALAQRLQASKKGNVGKPAYTAEGQENVYQKSGVQA
jgi:hypothetical protein